MLRELLEAYAETLKMKAKTPSGNMKLAFWRPWLDTGKFFVQLTLFCNGWDQYNVLVVDMCGNR